MRLPNTAHPPAPGASTSSPTTVGRGRGGAADARGLDDFPGSCRTFLGCCRGSPRRRSQGSSRASRTLWAIRWKVGELLGWDGPDAGLGSRAPTLRDRLPADLRDAPPGPQLHRYLALPARRRVGRRSPPGPFPGHARRLGPRPGRRQRGQMAVYVKPNGLLGTAYVAAGIVAGGRGWPGGAIKPFRHLIVYRRWATDRAALAGVRRDPTPAHA
jgi:Protein of unknown function (DUF2867)